MGVDVFATEATVGNMASEVVMDPIAAHVPTVRVPGVPPILVVNVQLPSAPPALMSAAEDGPGYQVIRHLDRYVFADACCDRRGDFTRASTINRHKCVRCVDLLAFPRALPAMLVQCVATLAVCLLLPHQGRHAASISKSGLSI